eukprot:10930921-Alexandrium_andersonii.AAC.1
MFAGCGVLSAVCGAPVVRHEKCVPKHMLCAQAHVQVAEQHAVCPSACCVPKHMLCAQAHVAQPFPDMRLQCARQSVSSSPPVMCHVSGLAPAFRV